MTGSGFEDKQFFRYLNILGIQKQEPGIQYLNRIIESQVEKIPFENISKLYYKKRYNLTQLIDFDRYLEGIENDGFGGTCYAINYYLNRLLNWLGFEVKLCGADMNQPDVHIVNIVHIEGREFLVDSGYAAPFSEPMPLDLQRDYTVQIGTYRYVIKPDFENGYSSIGLYHHGEHIHGYSVNPKGRAIHEFQQIIQESFDEKSTFMNDLLLTRFDKGQFLRLHNLTFQKFDGEDVKETSIHTLEQLIFLIHEHFFIPQSIIVDSIQGLQLDLPLH